MPYSIGKPTKNKTKKSTNHFFDSPSIPIGKRLYNDGRQKRFTVSDVALKKRQKIFDPAAAAAAAATAHI
jgi:hypothetical protein